MCLRNGINTTTATVRTLATVTFSSTGHNLHHTFSSLTDAELTFCSEQTTSVKLHNLFSVLNVENGNKEGTLIYSCDVDLLDWATSVIGVVTSTDITINLKTGKSTGVSSANGSAWITPLTGGPPTATCDRQGLLKLTFNTVSRKKATIVLRFASQVTDFAFNIGDSQTNNGYAGDGGSQANDAEIHAVGKAIYFYGRDKSYGVSYGLIYTRNNFLVNTVTMNISNGLITAESSAGFIYIDSDKMFALNGQSDFEGPVNYDLYFGFNRVVAGGRYGSGLCSASITWSA